MLIIAGVLFSLAVLLWIINSLTEAKANLDLRWTIQILIFLAAGLIAYNFYKGSQEPKNTKSPPTVEAPVKLESIVIRDVNLIDEPNNLETSLANRILRMRFMLDNEETRLLKYSRSRSETVDLFAIKFEDDKRIDDLLSFMGYEVQYLQLLHSFYLLRKGHSVVFASTLYEEGIPLLDEVTKELKRRGYLEKKVTRVTKVLDINKDLDFQASNTEDLIKRINQAYKKLFDEEETDSKIINLTKSWFINERGAAFSPDGKYIACAGNTIHGFEVHPMPSDIYLMESDGSDEHRLFESTTRYILPTWSGAVKVWSDDGTRIYVHGWPSLEVPIQYYDLTSNKLCGITNEEMNSLPRNSLSPNGKMQIYFPTSRSGVGTSIGVKYLDTSTEEIVVPEDTTKKWSAAWGPDSEWIAYNDKEFGEDETEIYIHVVNVKTKENRRLARGLHPNWSPDGKYIAFCSISLSPDIFLYKWHLEE